MMFVNDCDPCGTSLMGYMNATYYDLVTVFGEPNYGPNDSMDDKVTCEWNLTFEDGTVATIYDYKEGSTPFYNYDWHIGGHNMDAVTHVMETFKYGI
jgi:hypothetical protein